MTLKLTRIQLLALAIIESSLTITPQVIKIILQTETGEDIRIDRVITSLSKKGLIKTEPLKINDSINLPTLPKISFDPDTVKNFEMVSKMKLGKSSKLFLYILSKIDHASLQFLSATAKTNQKNTFAILQRLEYWGLVSGYSSRIMHFNSYGRRYNPKFYHITNLGRLTSQLKNKNNQFSEIDSMLDIMAKKTTTSMPS